MWEEYTREQRTLGEYTCLAVEVIEYIEKLHAAIHDKDDEKSADAAEALRGSNSRFEDIVWEAGGPAMSLVEEYDVAAAGTPSVCGLYGTSTHYLMYRLVNRYFSALEEAWLDRQLAKKGPIYWLGGGDTNYERMTRKDLLECVVSIREILLGLPRPTPEERDRISCELWQETSRVKARRLAQGMTGDEVDLLQIGSPGAETAAESGEEQSPYSKVQREILKALKGRALTLDELQQETGLSRSALTRKPRGIGDLQKSGVVKNDRVVGGYYRPDAPPEL